MVLEKMSEDEAKEEKKEKEDKSKGNDNNPGKKDRVKSESSNTPVVYSATKDKEDKNNSSNKGNDDGNKDKNNDNDSKNSNNGKGNDKSDAKGNENAVNRGNGKKIGLLKKLGIYEDEKKTGQVENILAVVDQIVNGKVNLSSGEHEELFALVREVG